MSWNSLKTLSAGLAALAVVGTVDPAAANTLVVRSVGPSAASYPPGTTLADTARIVLKQNDRVILLDGRGTRTLNGPGSFNALAATSSGIDARSTFAALVAQRGQRRARIGAVRNMTAAPPRSANIWFVDVGRSSTVCVGDPTALTLWRADAAQPANATLTGASGGGGATVSWNENEATTPWPAALPVTAGATYSIGMAGAAQPATVRFVSLGAAPQGLEDLASALIRNGCDAQLDLLIETASAREDGPAPGG